MSGCKSQSKPYIGGDTMPPFPAMHGSMFYEPETIEACADTLCCACAYQLFKIDLPLKMTKGNCTHREIMIQAELMKI